ncbi:hypothetical protein ACQVP2_31165 [Methylobacterium aquaticum]|jgi:hypothetical protein|uniref:hypothetical protein n=1 Tax=Methylobacterium aquaticum TaxID=270351 RepID=UPI003D17217B
MATKSYDIKVVDTSVMKPAGSERKREVRKTKWEKAMREAAEAERIVSNDD